MQQVSPESVFKSWRASVSTRMKAACTPPLARGSVTPPGSRTVSRTKGQHRNPGDPTGSDGMVPVGGVARGKTGALR